jgi:D-3-phosphoglycerate dehydrogenase
VRTTGDIDACLVLQPIRPEGLERLRSAGIEVFEGEADPQAAARITAVVTRDAPVDAAFMDRFPALRVIGKHGTGLDAIDLGAATARGIAVVFTPGANAAAVAEHTFALALAVAKRLRSAHDAAVAGEKRFRAAWPSWDLAGATFAIAGFGAVGEHVARVARAFSMHPIAFSPHAPEAALNAAGVERAGSLRELAARADVLSLHLPLRPDNHGMLGAGLLAALRPAAIVVNTARAELIDQPALVDALERGMLAGAGLDVFDPAPAAAGDRLTKLANVVLSPHTAGSSQAALRAAALLVTQGVLDVLNGRRPASLANPEVATAAEPA